MTQGNSSCNVIIKRNALFAEDLVKGSQGRERKEEGKEGSGNEAESGETERSDVISSMLSGDQTHQ